MGRNLERELSFRYYHRYKFIILNGLDPRSRYPLCDVCCYNKYTEICGRWVICDSCKKYKSELSSLKLEKLKYDYKPDKLTFSDTRKLILSKQKELEKLFEKKAEQFEQVAKELGYDVDKDKNQWWWRVR